MVSFNFKNMSLSIQQNKHILHIILIIICSFLLSALTCVATEYILPFIHATIGKWIKLVCLFLPITLIILAGCRFSILSIPKLIGFLVISSICDGVLFTVFIDIYTKTSILNSFASSITLFCIMGLMGIFFKLDLSKYRQLFLIGLVGVIITSFINIFFNVALVSWVTSLITIPIMCYFIADDFQEIKNDINITLKTKLLSAINLRLWFANILCVLLRVTDDRN